MECKSSYDTDFFHGSDILAYIVCTIKDEIFGNYFYFVLYLLFNFLQLLLCLFLFLVMDLVSGDIEK